MAYFLNLLYINYNLQEYKPSIIVQWQEILGLPLGLYKAQWIVFPNSLNELQVLKAKANEAFLTHYNHKGDNKLKNRKKVQELEPDYTLYSKTEKAS